MELALAIYAAVVGSLALAWEVYRWARSRRPDVLVVPGELADRAGRWVTATVVNRGSHPIRLQSWGISRVGEEMVHVHVEPEEVPIPPSDATTLRLHVHELLGIEPGQRVEAWVYLTTGDRFASRPLVAHPDWFA